MDEAKSKTDVGPAKPPPKLDQLKDLFERSKPTFMAVLPAHLPAERVIKIALASVSRTPRLMDCTTTSLLQSVMMAAELGLEPGGPLKHAHLVPYKNKHTGQYECQLIPGYQGLIHLAKESGETLTVEAHIVHKNDQFSFNFGFPKSLLHSPALSDPGPMVAVYAIAYLKQGDPQFVVMRPDEIDAIRKRSKASEDGPWKTDYEEMAKKTAVRRLAKYLKLSENRKLAKALEVENRAEGEDGDVLDLVDYGTEAPPQEAERAPVQQPKETAPPPTEKAEGATTEDLKTRVQKKIAKLCELDAGTPEKILAEFSSFESTKKGEEGKVVVATSIDHLCKSPKWAEKTIERMIEAIRVIEEGIMASES